MAARLSVLSIGLRELQDVHTRKAEPYVAASLQASLRERHSCGPQGDDVCNTARSARSERANTLARTNTVSLIALWADDRDELHGFAASLRTLHLLRYRRGLDLCTSAGNVLVNLESSLSS